MTQSTQDIQDSMADIEAIKQLKARYAMACDDSYDPEALAAMFVENAIWDGGEFGRYEGRDAIHDYFADMHEVVEWAVHYMSNPVIEVEQERATGRWYLWQPMTLKADSQAILLSAHYHDHYVKRDGQWFFQQLSLDVKFFSPYEVGFGKMQFMPLPV